MRVPSDLEHLTPARLWSALDPATREESARALYTGTHDEGAGRRQANRAIAAALRFRDVAVAQLPVERRVGYLTRVVQPDDGLAYALLMALHLGHRRELLAAFLDALAIPQQNGLIDEGHTLVRPPDALLGRAVAGVYERFPASQVTLYLTSLLVMDAEIWGGVEPLIRRDAPAS